MRIFLFTLILLYPCLVKGQQLSTKDIILECNSIIERVTCDLCDGYGRYGESGSPKIPCQQCENVTEATLANYPCNRCGNTRKVKNPNYIPPTRCGKCKERGLLITKGPEFEVASHEYTKRLNWNDANYVCNSYGNGWRLPTIHELAGIHEFLFRKGKGDFKDNSEYWSSTPHEEGEGIYVFGFNHQNPYTNTDDESSIKFVRAVRSLPTKSKVEGGKVMNGQSRSGSSSFECGKFRIFDYDGNEYNTILLNGSCWMQSNLRTSKYNNGDQIDQNLSNSIWQTQTEGAYAVYKDDKTNEGLLGNLYNYYAVKDSRGLCPTGWHVPSPEEYTELFNIEFDNRKSASSFKSTDRKIELGGWLTMSQGATNASGFSAKPGGYRVLTGEYYGINEDGRWWTNHISSNGLQSAVVLSHNSDSEKFVDLNPNCGLSIRCLKDN